MAAGSAALRPPSAPQEDRKVIWAHAGTEAQLNALTDIGTLVARSQPGVSLLLTCEDRLSTQIPSTPNLAIKRSDLPMDSPRATGWFLDLHQPDFCLWAANTLKPTLLQRAKARGVTLLMLDPDPTRLPTKRRPWFSDPVGQSLTQFDAILVRDETTARQMARFGAPEDRVQVTSPLRPVPFPPPCPDEDVRVVSSHLSGRPVWFVAGQPQPETLQSIVEAHAAAVRLSHRLLMVIDPGSQGPAFRSALDAAGLRHVDWHFGEPIEDITQVLLLRDPDDMPLWYRLAPVTYIPGHASARITPMVPAALGSGVLFDPDPRMFSDAYAALVTAGAARRVRTTEALSRAVLELSAPDRAAAMALAGWEVVTEGAPLANQAARLVVDALDGAGG